MTAACTRFPARRCERQGASGSELGFDRDLTARLAIDAHFSREDELRMQSRMAQDPARRFRQRAIARIAGIVVETAIAVNIAQRDDRHSRPGPHGRLE